MTVKELAKEMREQGKVIMTAQEKLELDETRARFKEEHDTEEAFKALVYDLVKRVENLENEVKALRQDNYHDATHIEYGKALAKEID